jgi:ABC-type lipoprotein release transport system permease subunit
VPIALVVPAAIATLLPARRAMRVNPLDAIQAE